ncbi:MAG: hypothetical protein ACJAXS_001595 [Colwellia sp.]|jgi:hypothetical protein
MKIKERIKKLFQCTKIVNQPAHVPAKTDTMIEVNQPLPISDMFKKNNIALFEKPHTLKPQYDFSDNFPFKVTQKYSVVLPNSDPSFSTPYPIDGSSNSDFSDDLRNTLEEEDSIVSPDSPSSLSTPYIIDEDTNNKTTYSSLLSKIQEVTSYGHSGYETSINCLMQRILPVKSVGFLIGESQAFKSFIAVSIGACISKGRDFGTLKVPKEHLVFYIAAEGGESIPRRLKAEVDK